MGFGFGYDCGFGFGFEASGPDPDSDWDYSCYYGLATHLPDGEEGWDGGDCGLRFGFAIVDAVAQSWAQELFPSILLVPQLLLLIVMLVSLVVVWAYHRNHYHCYPGQHCECQRRRDNDCGQDHFHH